MPERLALSFAAQPHTFRLRGATFHVPKGIMSKTRRWRFMLDLTRTCEIGAEEAAHDLVGFETPEPVTYMALMQEVANQVREAIKEADDEETEIMDDGQRYAGWTRIEWKVWIIE